MKENWLIIILIIVILLLGGILALKIFTPKYNNKYIEDGTDYVQEKVLDSREELDIEIEKYDIQSAIGMAILGNNTIEPLTYNNLDKYLKQKFGAGNYTLTGPNSSGNFTLEINTRVYTINSNGKISE